MFAEHYGFSGEPFQLTPDHRFFFGSACHVKTLSFLQYGLDQGEGFIVITGEVGAGKTTVIGHLLSGLEAQRYVSARISTTQLGPEDFLRSVLAAFGLSAERTRKASLLREFEAFLRRADADGRRALLVVDEAQNLPRRSLEELRMLSNLQTEHRALLQSFLVGQPQFRAVLADPRLEQLRQRVIATHHLGPMDAGETRAYVEHRLEMVGWRRNPDLADDAFELLHARSGGIPRKINMLANRILLYGALERLVRIDGNSVRTVIADLEEEGAAPLAGGATPTGRTAGPGRGGPGLRLIADRLCAIEASLQRQERGLIRVVERIDRALGTGRTAPEGVP
jgi:general secretion pathway protein A